MKALKCFSSEGVDFSPAADSNGASLDQWRFRKYPCADVWDLHVPVMDPSPSRPSLGLSREDAPQVGRELYKADHTLNEKLVSVVIYSLK